MTETLSEFANPPAIVTFHADGRVEFAEHLSPAEGAEEAWRLLLQKAEQHNAALARPAPAEGVVDLQALSEAATNFDLSTAEIKEDGFFECPVCQGDGEVDGEQYVNIDGIAANVMFSGIGKEFGANRDFILALVEAYRSGRLVERSALSSPEDATPAAPVSVEEAYREGHTDGVLAGSTDIEEQDWDMSNARASLAKPDRRAALREMQSIREEMEGESGE